MERLAREPSDGRILVPGDTEWEAYRLLLVAREEEHPHAGAEKARLESSLKLAIGTASELGGVATWRTRRKTKFDVALFKHAQPDLHREFTVEVTDRPFKPL